MVTSLPASLTSAPGTPGGNSRDGSSDASAPIRRLRVSDACSSPAAPSILSNAPSSMGGRTLSLASVGSGTFPCKRCKLVLPMAYMDALKAGVCKKDVLSYKSISDRWQKDRRLKTWWDSLGDSGIVNWYVTQHDLKQGEKRKLDVQYLDQSKRTKLSSEMDVDRLIPFDVFWEKAANKHKDFPTATRDFMSIVESNAADCRYERGQWVVPHWEGIEIKRGAELAQSSITNRVALDVVGPEALKQHMEAGQRLLDQFAGGFQPVKGSGVLTALDAPQSSTACTADMPRSSIPADVMAAAAHREVAHASQALGFLFWGGDKQQKKTTKK